MVVDERTRVALYMRLSEVLGTDEADTLMAHLPPVGWADVATKHDLEAQTVLLKRDLEGQTALLRGEMEALEHRLVAVFRGELVAAVTAQTRLIIFALLGTVLTMTALVFAAARL